MLSIRQSDKKHQAAEYRIHVLYKSICIFKCTLIHLNFNKYLVKIDSEDTVNNRRLK